MLRYMLFGVLLANCQLLRADLLIVTDQLLRTDLRADVEGDGSIQRSLGFNLRFFGETLSGIRVSENGNLTNATYEDFYPLLLKPYSIPPPTPNPDPQLRIAPLWDNFYIAPGFGHVYEQKQAGYYSVTWENAILENALPTTILSTQVAIFAADTTIENFTFKPNDIVFSYQDVQLGFAGLVSEIGLRTTTGSSYVQFIPNDRATAPAGEAGYVTQLEAQTYLPEGNSFILFREQLDGNGAFIGYDVSVQSVPEPSSIALVLGALVPLGFQTLRKRLRANKVARSTIDPGDC